MRRNVLTSFDVNSGPMLSIGSTGPDVRRLQILFVMIKEMDCLDIDGDFGPKTQEAVKSIQQGSNLTADGVVGPLTWKALPAAPQYADAGARCNW